MRGGPCSPDTRDGQMAGARVQFWTRARREVGGEVEGRGRGRRGGSEGRSFLISPCPDDRAPQLPFLANWTHARWILLSGFSLRELWYWRDL